MKEYTRLEYIESDGNQWIDTGVIGKSGLSAEIDMEFNVIPTDGGVVGARNGNVRFYLFHYYQSWMYGYGEYYQSGVTTSVNRRHTIKTTLNVGSQSMSIDGVSVASGNLSNNYNTNLNVYVGAFNYDGKAHYPTSMKIYRLVMWESTGLVREYIPVKNSEGVCGLYDRVEDKFYPSQGTSGFIAGKDIEDKPLSFPYGFRRRCMSVAKRGTHIKEGLDFWFDGLDNQATGIYYPSATSWVAKTDNDDIRNIQFELKGISYFGVNGGVVSHPSKSSDIYGASTVGLINPFYYLPDYNKNNGFTFEVVVDFEKDNTFFGYSYFWGITYNGYAGYANRGGLVIRDGALAWRCVRGGVDSWVNYSSGVKPSFGKQVITMVLTTYSELKFYVNGREFGNSVSVPSDFKIANTEYNRMTLGNYVYNEGGMYGTFYSFKAYSRVLSDKEIMDSANFAKSYYKL